MMPRALLGLLLLAAAPAMADGARLVQVQWPRSFGYRVGDLVPVEATVELAPGWQPDRDGLPEVGRGNGTFELRRREFRADAACSGCRRLLLEWQLLKSVRVPSALSLPRVALRFRSAEQVAEVDLPEFAVSAAPLQDWLTRRDWMETMGPSVAATPFDAAAAAGRALAWLAAAVTLALLWAYGSGRIAAPRSRPFARGWRQARRLPRDAPAREALRIMHRSFDDSAGYAVFADNLDRYFDQRPQFRELAAEARTLFAASREVFFGDAAQAPATAAIERLLRRLRDRERIV